MLTALVLQLIQCVVVLPDRLGSIVKTTKQTGKDTKKDVKKEANKAKDNKESGEGVEEQNDPEASMDRDVVVNLRWGQHFFFDHTSWFSLNFQST